MTRAGILVGVLATLVGACKAASVSLDNYDDELLRARCQRFVRCGLFVDDDACESYFRVVPDVNRQPAIDAGKVRYDGESAKRCNDAIAAQTCDGASRDGRLAPAACSRVFVGNVADGDTCADDLECASQRCNRPLATCQHGACCAGTCASSTRAAIGDACNNTSDCIDDAFCGQDMTCHALGKAGDNCFIDNQCDFGLACAGTGFPKMCAAVGAIGDACPDGRCAEIGAACSPSGSCVAAGLPGANAPCTTDAACSIYALCDGTACVAYPTTGMTCDARGCAGDAYCDLSSMPGVCSAPLADKAPCTGDFDCESVLCVEGPVFDDCEARPVCL